MDTSKTIISYKNRDGLENAIINVQNEKWLINFRDKLIQINDKNIDSIIFDSMDIDALLFEFANLQLSKLTNHRIM